MPLPWLRSSYGDVASGVSVGEVRDGLSAGGRWIRTIGTPQRNNVGRPPPFDPPQFAFRKRNRFLRTRNRWFESTSLQQTVSLSPSAAFQGGEPRFSARVWAAGLATGSAETRQALHCAPTGGNISVGPYSSTAVPLRWLAKMPRRSRQSWVYSALKVRGSLNSDWAQAKPSTIR